MSVADVVLLGHKRCSICSEIKTYEHFYREKRRQDGYGSRCKDCQREYMRGYQETNKEKVRELWRSWYAENNEALRAAKRRHYEAERDKILAKRKANYDAEPEVYRARSRAWRADWRRKNPEKVQAMDRRSDLKRHYGMTVEEYDALLAAQRGVCAICAGTCSSGRRLAVDHDHDTGRVRGLLCGNCNRAIGHLRDDPALLRAAIDYLNG